VFREIPVSTVLQYSQHQYQKGESLAQRASYGWNLEVVRELVKEWVFKKKMKQKEVGVFACGPPRQYY
jgi:hypothetical protein